MFKNAGKKLGILIKTSFTISMISSLIFWLYIGQELLRLEVRYCIIFFVISIFPVYLIHLIMYAFAELCENVHNINMTVTALYNVNDTFDEDDEDDYENNPELERATLAEINRAKREQIEKDNRYN